MSKKVKAIIIAVLALIAIGFLASWNAGQAEVDTAGDSSVYDDNLDSLVEDYLESQ
jgi:hypothetical protein